MKPIHDRWQCQKCLHTSPMVVGENMAHYVRGGIVVAVRSKCCEDCNGEMLIKEAGETPGAST